MQLTHLVGDHQAALRPTTREGLKQRLLGARWLVGKSPQGSRQSHAGT
jgi:hypothetical protein